MAKHATAVDYIAPPGLPLRAIAMAACRATGAALPAAQAAARRAPGWIIGTAPVGCLTPASRHLTSGFWGGASIHDPARRLEAGGQVVRTQSRA